MDDFLEQFPELANAVVTFGLQPKDRQRVTDLLALGWDWPEIAKDVGWERETLKRFYYRTRREE